jgi:2-haloacid dehalogenase
MAKTIVFDVNETMLDLRALDPIFERHFGDAAVRGQWFSQVLLTSMTITLVGDYANFAKVGGAALAMVCERRGVTLSEDQRGEIVKGMRELPPHPDVEAGLKTLRENDYRLVTLTNSPPAVVEAQLNFAGLAEHIDAMLSVDKIKKFKPDPAVYGMAADELGEKPADLWLVAAHNWDTTGALAAGWKAGFIARPNMVTGPLDREPTVRGATLPEVVAGILAAG